MLVPQPTIRSLPKYVWLLWASIAIALSGCEKSGQEVATEATPAPVHQDNSAANDAFWRQGDEILSASLQKARALQQNTQDFLTQPDEAQLTELRQAWLALQQQWHRFYFYSEMGISQPVVFGQLAEYSFRIAAHPIQPGYLDYFGPYPYSGLVHDISVALNQENLINQHGMTDQEDVAMGLYAIEFLLNGEQGARPASDYNAVSQLTGAQQEQGFRQVSETPNFRRRELLRLQTSILVASLEELQTLWNADDAAAMRTAWQDIGPQQQLDSIRKNLERTLTQLLLDIVATTPAADTETTDMVYDSSASPAALAASIRSLQVAGDWLPPPRGETLQKCLARAAEGALTAQTREAWGEAYQTLKSCLPSP